MLSLGPLVLAAATSICAPAAHPIVAEVYYDAIGDDTGQEFVELFNPGDAPFALSGLRLEAGDGAGPGRWTLRWTGGALDTIRAHGRFVIGGALVSPAPDATVQLDLQNGPDAVRLVWPDGATEVVGYGALAYPEYSCGAPGPDVPSGQSLARVPDDADLGGNALDFRAAEPSPGRANRPSHNAALIAGALSLAPEQPAPGVAARLRGAVANKGAGPLASGEIAIAATLRTSAGETPLAGLTLDRALAPGDSAWFEAALPGLPAGKHVVLARVGLASDEVAADDLDSLRVRAGPGSLEITEIQFHPASGEGEWVEVRNRSGVALDLGGFTLSDRGSTRGVPEGGAASLAAESLAVIAQNRATFLAHYPAIDASRVWQGHPWPALNNSDDSTGFADAVWLREADGTSCDRVDYSASGIPAGVPIERRDGGWWPDTDPAGTPLAPPRALPALGAHFEANPRRLFAGAGATRLSWALPWQRARVAVEVYDLGGRRASVALADGWQPGRAGVEWAIGDLPPGMYVAVLRAKSETGAETIGASVPLRIDGRRP